MENLKKLINSKKGKITVLAVGFILGFGVVATQLGIELVDGPEGAVCIQASVLTEEVSNVATSE